MAGISLPIELNFKLSRYNSVTQSSSTKTISEKLKIVPSTGGKSVVNIDGVFQLELITKSYREEINEDPCKGRSISATCQILLKPVKSVMRIVGAKGYFKDTLIMADSDSGEISERTDEEDFHLFEYDRDRGVTLPVPATLSTNGIGTYTFVDERECESNVFIFYYETTRMGVDIGVEICDDPPGCLLVRNGGTASSGLYSGSRYFVNNILHDLYSAKSRSGDVVLVTT